MCKASNSTISVNRLFEKIDGTTYTYTGSIGANQAYTYITVPISSSSTYSISIQSISGKTNYSWLGCNFGIYIDNTRYDNYAYNLMEGYGPYTCNLSNLQGGNNLYFKLKNDYANQTLSNIVVTHSDIIINETMNISKPSGDSVLYRDVVGLGKECGITILGYHTDGERIDHGNGGGLPLEFVEKIVVTKGSSSTMSVGTYNFNTYIIGVAENEQQSFKIGYWYSNYIYPGYSQNPIGMDSVYMKAGLPITIFGQYIPTGSTITVYVYKLNLPS